MNGMREKIKTRWANYQPNKQSLYKAVGYTAFWTVLLGFTAGGWTTSGGAEKMAYEARVDYAAATCAERFLAADMNGQRLASLKKIAGRHQRRRVLEKEEWLTVPAGSTPEFIKAAQLACGERLMGIGAGTGTGVDGKTA